jgi:hypothetical protein
MMRMLSPSPLPSWYATTPRIQEGGAIIGEGINVSISQAVQARIVRKDIMNTTTSFDGTFSAGCQNRSLPQSLQTLVAMLCDGANIKEQSFAKQNQAQLTICQLIVFNSLITLPQNTITDDMTQQVL